jgi:hypothetical protein
MDTLETIQYDCGVYQGEVSGWWPTRIEHGRGVFSWTNGDRFSGDFVNGEREGRGAFHFADDSRRFEGSWTKDYPLRGTAIDSNGIIFCAEFDGHSYISDAWTAGARMPEWRRWGRRLHGNLGSCDLGPTAEWAGTIERVDGTRFEGIMRGLCPVGGVETELGGARFRVTYSGDCTLAEDPLPVMKEVRQVPEHMLIVGDPFAMSYNLIRLRFAASGAVNCSGISDHSSSVLFRYCLSLLNWSRRVSF